MIDLSEPRGLSQQDFPLVPSRRLMLRRPETARQRGIHQSQAHQSQFPMG
jgi:hypothetical protein